jgi:fructose-1-phosphate kinase PfkB-like protein
MRLKDNVTVIKPAAPEVTASEEAKIKAEEDISSAVASKEDEEKLAKKIKNSRKRKL